MQVSGRGNTLTGDIMAKDSKDSKDNKKKETKEDKTKKTKGKEKEKEGGEEIELEDDDHKILDGIWKERQEETRKKLDEARKKRDNKK
jgi:hypothetical protein